ncbi:hypothetical protein FGRMN_11226, partial [Fusarium graminum]
MDTIDATKAHSPDDCQRGFENIAEIPEGEKPKKSMPPTVIFVDNEHRTIPIVFLENIFSRWTPEENYEEMYGIVPDGCVTHYFGVVALDPNIASAFPDVNESFSLYTSAPWVQHKLPFTVLTLQQAEAVAVNIVSAFHLGELKA